MGKFFIRIEVVLVITAVVATLFSLSNFLLGSQAMVISCSILSLFYMIAAFITFIRSFLGRDPYTGSVWLAALYSISISIVAILIQVLFLPIAGTAVTVAFIGMLTSGAFIAFLHFYFKNKEGAETLQEAVISTMKRLIPTFLIIAALFPLRGVGLYELIGAHKDDIKYIYKMEYCFDTGDCRDFARYDSIKIYQVQNDNSTSTGNN